MSFAVALELVQIGSTNIRIYLFVISGSTKMRMHSSPLLSKMDHKKEEKSKGAADEDEGDYDPPEPETERAQGSVTKHRSTQR